MDKGLDIAGRRHLLGLHAALDADARALSIAFPPDDAHSGASPRATLDARLDAIARRLAEAGLAPRWDLADRALEWAGEPGHAVLTPDDADYPVRLLQIAQPPPVLFVDGDPAALARLQVAVVGSRKASRSGLAAAHELACGLTDLGVMVTSGLATGIDSAAHRGALSAGGTTVAVFGCGIDRVYPACHVDLARQIGRAGVLVSEFPLGAPPRRHHFPQRNRVISGLALGVVVVEAAERSGSISTAMHAMEQGREVFAVPGSVHNPLTRGCHALIKQGAKLTEKLADIVDELPQIGGCAAPHEPLREEASRCSVSPLSSGTRAARLLDACGWDRFTTDEIVARSGLTVQEVSSMLLALELAGVIETVAAGTHVRIR